MSLRPAAAPLRVCSVVLLIVLGACAERQALPNDPTGRLFARGLDEITDLYIAPVSNRLLVLSGAARLSRLDDKLSVAENSGAGEDIPRAVLCRERGGRLSHTLA